MYKFNPQHIAALSSGKAILAHTKKEEDLPLLRAVMRETFSNYFLIPTGISKYFFLAKEYRFRFNTSNYILCNMEMLPIIPLHDFLLKDELPKEDLDRIDLMDKRLKELEGLVRGYGYTIAPKAEIADQTADLIKWVLDNQDKVIKLKNNDK